MFGKKKTEANRFIIAVKSYDDTVTHLKKGDIKLSSEPSAYLKLLESQSSKVDSQKELGKFIKLSNKEAKEVKHYWEGLIEEGYTLVNVKYENLKPSLDHLCNSDTIRFVVAV
jgi:hypothetical protein